MTTSTRGGRLSRPATGALVVLVAVTIGAIAWATVPRVREGTALLMPNRSGMTWDEATVGDRYTDVWVKLIPVDDRSITIETVDLLGDFEDGVEVLDMLVSDAPILGDMLFDYPPNNSSARQRKLWGQATNLRPVEGATLHYQGDKAHSLIIGIEVAKPGRWFRTHLRVNYTEDGQRFTQDLPIEFLLCTRKVRCPDPE